MKCRLRAIVLIGLVAVLVATPLETDRGTLRIDTWLMSCRVIGRSAEQFLFGLLMDRAERLGYRRILGEYIPTKKNGLARDLFARLGFSKVGDEPDGTTRWELDLAGYVPAEVPIKINSIQQEHVYA